MSTSTETVSPSPGIYLLPPPGDPTYHPLHLFTPTGVPYDPRTDPVFRLPSPQVLPSLPLITDQAMYLRAFCLYEFHIEGQDRHQLQAWGDELYEWMIQTTLYNNFGMMVRREFNHYYEEILIENIINAEQARYFATLYDFDSRMHRHNLNTLTHLEIKKYLPDTFYAYIGAVEMTRGKGVLLKWLRDLIKPIIEYRVDDLTKNWSAKTRTRATKNWDKNRIHSDFKIEEKAYEIEDFEWMGANWETWGMTAAEIVDGMLKNMRRHLRAYIGPSRTVNEPIITCDSEWHPNEKVWSFVIRFSFSPDAYYIGVHQNRKIAEFHAVWKAMDQVKEFGSEMFTYATWF
ncbi:uncharacterized protein DFL_007057 [Arthrobotrys flagrans]|uniref:Uncharacterized protein n=1 Tax=Arthrobotrys flagrans TaxID=97331 RepID=A0A436ZUM5_ARTFL|nr:hypothetical protein DFL_007057 [Arthrobotrys flagrans]